MAMSTPTVRRKQLGNELRHLRVRAKLGDEKVAAEALERTQATLSRIESGLTGIRQMDLRRLLDYYAAHIEDGDEIDIDGLIELNKGAESRGRWRDHRASHAKWFRMAVDLETDASAINTYRTELIWGPLQTEGYARARFAEAQVRAIDNETKNAIKARQERREVLTRPNGPELTVILSESAIQRMVGSPEIMREQLRDTAELAERPNIHIHVLPFRCKTAVSVTFPFVHFRVPSASANAPALEFIYLEQYDNSDYLDDANHVSTYSGLWNGLLGAALGQVESREFLRSTARSY